MTQLLRTAQDHKGLLEVFKRLPLREDLLCDPVLGGDGGNIGVVLSPRVVGFMKPGKLRKKKRASLLLLCITVLLTATDTSSRPRMRLGGTVSLKSYLSRRPS